jgi:hypothetical protein
MLPHTASSLWLWGDSIVWIFIAAELNAYCASGILLTTQLMSHMQWNFGQQLVRFLKGRPKPQILHRLMPDLRPLHPPETIVTESAIEVEKESIGEGEGAGQNSPEGIMVSAT